MGRAKTALEIEGHSLFFIVRSDSLEVLPVSVVVPQVDRGAKRPEDWDPTGCSLEMAHGTRAPPARNCLDRKTSAKEEIDSLPIEQRVQPLAVRTGHLVRDREIRLHRLVRDVHRPARRHREFRREPETHESAEGIGIVDPPLDPAVHEEPDRVSAESPGIVGGCVVRGGRPKRT